jgi:hypothetical protein
MCDAKVLSHKGSAIITRAECQCVFIWNRNIILSFSPEQFRQFKTFVEDFPTDLHHFPFPNVQVRIMMCTPVESIQLAFTPPEWDDFYKAMEEAAHMQEVYALMD